MSSGTPPGPGGKFWEHAEYGDKKISSSGFVACAPGNINAGTESSMFALNIDLKDQDPVILTLVPPLVVTSGAGFYGFQPRPTYGLFAKIMWGTQAQPVIKFVDFGRGCSMAIWGAWLSVSVINESNVEFGSSSGSSYPASPAQSNGTPIFAPTAPPGTLLGPQAFLARGAFSKGLQVFTRQFLLNGQPLEDEEGRFVPPTGSTDPLPIPPFAQTVTVTPSPSIVSPGPPVIYNAYSVAFLDANGANIGEYSSDGTTPPIPISIPSDAVTITVSPQTGSLFQGRAVFSIDSSAA